MELNFGENIKRLRRSRDLTQEALADALGVSSQSVSKWECAYGYPDITQLPAIANYFGVTIDELLSNDEYGRKKDYEEYKKKINGLHFATEEQVEIILDYHRRYPDDLRYARMLCISISDHITKICPENREKYYPLLLQTAEKLINEPNCRATIAISMINACPEEELDRWLQYTSYTPETIRRNRLIKRSMALGKIDQQQVYIYLSNLEAFTYQFNLKYPSDAGKEKKGIYLKAILNTFVSFGDNGVIPDGWLAFAANRELWYAGCLLSMGKNDEGKSAFMSAIEKLRCYYSITEEYLDLGSSLFGDVRVNKNWKTAMDENGVEYKLFGLQYLMTYGEPDFTFSLLTDPYYTEFDCARNEGYYQDAVKWLKELTEKASD
ncbi:MAG: helix-turn-helix transcriptional regulator [Clostridia bacterium]|nr:helix-turn-helix transcriptional regulator [Clostridia bacterium]